MQINILKIIILRTNGADKVIMQTDMPCPFVPESGLTNPLDIGFDVSADHGEEYVKANFPGIPIEIIQV